MKTFVDHNGNRFGTNHGQAPAFPQNVNVQNGNGTTSPGYWNGSPVVRY